MARGIKSRQVCGGDFGDALLFEHGRGVVVLVSVAARFIDVVAGDNGDSGIEQPAREAASTAENISRRGCDTRCSFASGRTFHAKATIGKLAD